jgi:hypothetical protein
VIYGKGTGFTGRAVVVEGKTWIDAQANYDGQLRTGRFFSGDFTVSACACGGSRTRTGRAGSRWISFRTSTFWTRRATS